MTTILIIIGVIALVFGAWIIVKAMSLKGGMEATTKQYNAEREEYTIPTGLLLPGQKHYYVREITSEEAKQAIQDCQCEKCQAMWRQGLPQSEKDKFKSIHQIESEQHGEKE